MPEPEQRFGINTYSYTLTTSAVECLRDLSDRGYRAFELMLHPGHLWPHEEASRQLKALRRLLERRDLRIVSVNAPNIDLNIVAAAAEVRAYSLDFLSKAVRIAGQLGAGGMVMGPGKANPLLPVPRNVLVGRFHAAIERLAPLAERSGTSLWIENIPFAFLPDADGLMEAIDSYGNERIGVCYDIANGYFISEDPCAGLRRVQNRLRLVHVSDTGRAAYRHDAVGHGDVPFSAVPPVLAKVGYHEIPILEITSLDPDRDIVHSVEALLALGWAAEKTQGPAPSQ